MESVILEPQITSPTIHLDRISDEELLKLKACDLPIKIEGTWLQECIRELYQELESRGIVFKPECYLADEWLTPTEETCIGIPFYLAHPALIRLEKKFMIDAEGETKNWCMKLLRHETGHAICHAYQFQKRKLWQKIFGPSTVEYGDTYRYRPYSKNYVRHLDGFYAQYHPDEDFVETFAVWLTPGLDWRTKYRGWKALLKLDYVDRLMEEIKGKEPLVKSREKFWRLATLRYTLESYYKKKRQGVAEDFPDFHDASLRKMFSEKTQQTVHYPSVAHVIEQYKKNIIYSVSRCSGERKYIVNDLLRGIQKRARDLNLVTAHETQAMINLSSYITSLILNYLYTGKFRGHKNINSKK